jgi:hypothetical protein
MTRMSPQAAGRQGEVFLDARGDSRALRLTWHHDADLVVLSLWRGETCTGTFRLASADVDAFIDALVTGLRGCPDAPALPPQQRTGGRTVTPMTPRASSAGGVSGPDGPYRVAAS